MRSSVSRWYYAAYCAVTSDLESRGLSFAHGWQNPAHDRLPALRDADFVVQTLGVYDE